ncbi:MAG TPA: DUF4383 domain-containing protein [Candidatus Nanoarchaeia archaeon]|nr:DUF4383 domain-containing protein [Candidatus Nanoarchaeia archaeon]
MASVQKTFALILGLALLLVGILGFVSNPLVGESAIFTVNTPQTILHLIGGLIGLYVGLKGEGPMFNMVIGWLGIILGIVGFIPGLGHTEGDLLNTWLNINQSITILHLAIGIVSLAVYYGASKQ